MASKRISLYGVDPVEAIRAALNTPPPAKGGAKKKAAPKKSKARKGKR